MPSELPKFIQSAPNQQLPVIESDLEEGKGYFNLQTGEICIDSKLDPVGKHHILLHEMIHLATEKLKQAGLIKKSPSEDYVTYLTGTLFPMLVMSGLWNGITKVEGYDFIMSQREDENG